MDVLRSAAELKTNEVQESKQTAEILVEQVNEEKAIAEDELSAAEVILKEAEEAVKVNPTRYVDLFRKKESLLALRLADGLLAIESDVDGRLAADGFRGDTVDGHGREIHLVVDTSHHLRLHTGHFRTIQNQILCQSQVLENEGRDGFHFGILE